jgi:hypothetical protein
MLVRSIDATITDPESSCVAYTTSIGRHERLISLECDAATSPTQRLKWDDDTPDVGRKGGFAEHGLARAQTDAR